MMESPTLISACMIFPSGPGNRISRILKEHKLPADRIREIYLAVLSRPPTGAEVLRATSHLAAVEGEKAGYEDLMWALLNSSEFLFNH